MMNKNLLDVEAKLDRRLLVREGMVGRQLVLVECGRGSGEGGKATA